MFAGNRARRALTVAGAAAAALALWALTGPVAGLDPSAETGGRLRTVGAAPVIAGSLVAGLAGWGVLALLERTAARPGRIWTVLALAVLVLSLGGPLGSAGDGTSMAVLTGMHLIVAAVLIPGLGRTARAARPAERPEASSTQR
ncbi:DUF6069 family protein [Actinomadura madurae]|uniref:DUF6069 family protein n=1 Tax=Actinomadura madurae TaxID=1993 RepID=UPI00202743A0|nr:DUF6069 family protein [Actinomadura madurae]MCP9947597.1 DUF6069 family protein [Actinomadura madurae]URM93264.1 DUF6069 family protein [Actinomadura madurae]URN03989.1 DUF6069 family protein [Actinomadura madurae]